MLSVPNSKLIVYTDGGARGNPGPAAIGVVICHQTGQTIKKYSESIGQTTNNEAEYQAVIFALKKVKALFGRKKAKQMEIEIRLDSQLIAKQLQGQYKIQEKNLQPLFIKVWNLKLDFQVVTFQHIPRSQNKEADRLVNQVLNKKTAPSLLWCINTPII